MTNLRKFTIFGERNTGTKYLQKILQKMLLLKFTNEYGFKHWFIKNVQPRGAPNTTTDNECRKNIRNNDDTLFIVIVRNPYDWTGSMYKKPFHIQNYDKSSIYNFISKKYICYEKKQNSNFWKPNLNNKHKFFIEEADNLIELRNKKNNHFFSLKNKVKNFHLIRQEHLLKDIMKMLKKFKLRYRKINISDYKKPSHYKLDDKTKKFIKENLKNVIDKKFYLK